MLSYQWGHQSQVMKVKEYLQQNGITVWMDIDQMHDEINDRMAEAIFASKVIVLCMSRAYEISVNCQKEFNYADKKKKIIIPVRMEQFYPQSGKSLDLIIGNKLYYNLFDENVFDNEMERLVSVIKEKI